MDEGVRNDISIDAVFIADIARQGQSAVLNKGAPEHDRGSLSTLHIRDELTVDQHRGLTMLETYYRSSIISERNWQDP